LRCSLTVLMGPRAAQTIYFNMLEAILAAEELPDEYKSQTQEVLCNDCGERGTTRFHFVYHKCPGCSSFNTRVV
jgi:zinc finger-like protein